MTKQKLFECDGCTNQLEMKDMNRIDDDINGEVYYVCDDCFYNRPKNITNVDKVDTCTEFGEIIPETNKQEGKIL
jgi:hypothetical protein